jgi:CHAT domain-containing protein
MQTKHIAFMPGIRSSLPSLLALLILLAFSAECLAADPVAVFMAEADSLAATGGGADGLAEYVAGHLLLVGAAVGQLTDQALASPEAAASRFGLAGKLADLYKSQTGSGSLTELVGGARKWDRGQLALRSKAREIELQAGAARTAGDADGAIALLNQARGIYQSIGDKRSIAILWGTLGIAYWTKSDFEGAAQQYQEALAARRAIEDRILEGRTLNGLGSASYQLGRLEAAIDYYRQAIDLRTATGDTDGLATSLTYLGNAYIALGRILEARTTLEQALPLVKETGNAEQHYELLTSLASLNAEMGRTTSSNDALWEALALAQQIGDPKREIICRNNLALNFADAYRYGESLDQLDAVRALLDQHPDPEQEMIFHRNSGITNLRIGEVETARDEFNALLDLADKHRTPTYQLEALLNLGYLCDELDQLEEGLTYAERALALANETGSPKMEREALILAGQVERNLGQYESSAARWNAALAQDAALAANAQDSLGIDLTRDRIGLASVCALAGRAEEAREILRANQPAVDRSQDGDLIVATDFCLAHSFEKSDPESARLYYERGLGLIDRARADVGGTEVRTGFLGGSRRFYFEEVATYYAGLSWAQDGSQAGGGETPSERASEWSALAFRTIERSKARGLLDMLSASTLGTVSSAEEALLDSLYALDPTLPDYTDRERRVKDLYARLRQERLASSGAGRAEVHIAAPDEIRKALPRGTVLLEYALGDTMSLVWLVDRDGYSAYPLPKRADLEVAVGGLRDAIARPMPVDDALKRAARDLYLALLPPADDRLKKANCLVIVPDGALFELPFEVLLTDEPSAGAAWGDLPYLARRQSITYAPSASTYLALRGRPYLGGKNRKGLTDLVAMGDPDYSLLRPLSQRRAPLQPLPNTRAEVTSIAAMLKDEKDKNVDVYVGREANEAVAKARLREHPCRVVHFATHGIVDRAEPAASSIVLCPDPAGTEDGYLRTLEVLSSPIDVGLVVLSACESGRGEIGRGEGVVGFGRAFLAAGARNIVASLWAVSDESTAILMQAFYEGMISKRQPVGRALNEARLALLRDPRYAHPYYWSPFVAMGCEYAPW